METIQLKGIQKTFQLGGETVRALDDISLTVSRGDFVAIIGTSGSGKSTLMNIMGCLDHADHGEYFLEGVSVNQLDKNALADIRNQKIGFVFQGFNLLARTTALENVQLPLIYRRGKQIHDPQKKAQKALDMVGLSDRMHHEPNQLSGGQQQRVAIARALVTDPAIILADEPSGNLDSRTTEEILALFQQFNDDGITIVLVTHEMDVAEHAKRVVDVRDGRIINDYEISHRRYALGHNEIPLCNPLKRKSPL